VGPDQVHLTLKFIGAVPSSQLDEIRTVLTQVAGGFRRFTVRFDRIGAFPSPRRPRVIWLGVEPSPEMRFLKDDLERALAELGIPREARPYQPHITLGRAASGAEAGDFRALEEAARGLGVTATYDVTHLDLMRSRLEPDGAVHTRILAARLGTTAGDGGRRR
jgi:2'-5' RNA ligase